MESTFSRIVRDLIRTNKVDCNALIAFVKKHGLAKLPALEGLMLLFLENVIDLESFRLAFISLEPGPATSSSVMPHTTALVAEQTSAPVQEGVPVPATEVASRSAWKTQEQVIRDSDIYRCHAQLDFADKEIIRVFVEAGMSDEAVEQKLGLNRTAVEEVRKEFGLPRGQRVRITTKVWKLWAEINSYNKKKSAARELEQWQPPEQSLPS